MVNRLRKDGVWAAFLAVPLLLMIVFYLYPVIETFRLSLTDWNGLERDLHYVGFANYGSIFDDPRFLTALYNNLLWLIFYLTAPAAAGLLLASLLDTDPPGGRVFRILFFLPYAITPVAIGAIWKWIFVPGTGVAARLLGFVGMSSPNWLGDPAAVTWSLMVAALWWKTGFATIIFLAGLRAIPTEVIEAARLDRATGWTLFWMIKMPMLWPSIIIVLGMFSLESMRLFDLIYSMSGGGPFYSSDVLSTMTYNISFERFEIGKGAALSMVLFAVALVVILPYILIMTRRIAEPEA